MYLINNMKVILNWRDNFPDITRYHMSIGKIYIHFQLQDYLYTVIRNAYVYFSKST